jgi:hypothetical protein
MTSHTPAMTASIKASIGSTLFSLPLLFLGQFSEPALEFIFLRRRRGFFLDRVNLFIAVA